MEDRAFNLFGLNAPAWSLFWEYIANILYAFVLYRLARRHLIVLIIPAAILLCYTAYSAGNLLGGWAGSNFWDGAARIFYSFLAGLMIYRFNWIIKNKLGFIGLSLLLVLAFIMPWTDWNWLTELLVVLFFFPLIVALGAGARLSAGLKKLCEFSGNISYPLYMTHYAVIWIFGNYFTINKPNTTELTLIICIGSILLVGFAYLVMVVYDIPLRTYLNNKRKQHQKL